MSLIRLALPIISLAAGGVWMASGSSQASLSFDLPARELVSRLTASRTVEGSGMGSLRLSGSVVNPREVSISVTRAGGPGHVKCKVTIAETGDSSSSADVDCTQTGAKSEAINRIGGEAMVIVVAEHVRAAGLHQPYNTNAVADRMLAFMARNAPALAADMQRQAGRSGQSSQPQSPGSSSPWR